MPGRPLRQARQRAIHALTDQQAHEVALLSVQHLEREDALGLILRSLPHPAPREVVLRIASAPTHEARRYAADIAAKDPEAARMLIHACAQHPEVERALGITRTARQQLR